MKFDYLDVQTKNIIKKYSQHREEQLINESEQYDEAKFVYALRLLEQKEIDIAKKLLREVGTSHEEISIEANYILGQLESEPNYFFAAQKKLSLFKQENLVNVLAINCYEFFLAKNMIIEAATFLFTTANALVNLLRTTGTLVKSEIKPVEMADWSYDRGEYYYTEYYTKPEYYAVSQSETIKLALAIKDALKEVKTTDIPHFEIQLFELNKIYFFTNNGNNFFTAQTNHDNKILLQFANYLSEKLLINSDQQIIIFKEILFANQITSAEKDNLLLKLANLYREKKLIENEINYLKQIRNKNLLPNFNQRFNALKEEQFNQQIEETILASATSKTFQKIEDNIAAIIKLKASYQAFNVSIKSKTLDKFIEQLQTRVYQIIVTQASKSSPEIFTQFMRSLDQHIKVILDKLAILNIDIGFKQLFEEIEANLKYKEDTYENFVRIKNLTIMYAWLADKGVKPDNYDELNAITAEKLFIQFKQVCDTHLNNFGIQREKEAYTGKFFVGDLLFGNNTIITKQISLIKGSNSPSQLYDNIVLAQQTLATAKIGNRCKNLLETIAKHLNMFLETYPQLKTQPVPSAPQLDETPYTLYPTMC